MKTTKNALFLLFISSFLALSLFVQCSEDDEEDQNVSGIVINPVENLTDTEVELSGLVQREDVLNVGFVLNTNATALDKNESGAMTLQPNVVTESGEIFRLVQGLEPSTEYFYRIYADVVTNIETLETETIYSSTVSFTTLEIQDPDPDFLNVYEMFPEDGATDVPADVTLEITFDERVDVNSNTNTNFALTTPSKAFSERVTITTRSGSNVMTVEPESPLLAGAVYTLTIRPGFEGLSGKTLRSTFTSSFTVAN